MDGHSRALKDVEIGERGSATPRRSLSQDYGDEAQTIKVRNAKIEESLRDLERMTRAFKKRVEGIAGEFEGLREDVETLNLQYQGMEVNYHDALASVKEERTSATHYEGLLDNARIEIEFLQRAVPEKHHPTAYSQARPW